MTATARRYASPYVSQMLAEPDRTYDDCAASVGIMLAADWSCGEWTIEPDGDQRNVLTLRNAVRRKIGDTDGGLTFHDVNDFIHEYDPDLPDLPRYPGQRAKPGQSVAGATLRLDKAELKKLLTAGHSAGVCGYSGTVGHVIHVSDGTAKGVRRKDPLTRHAPSWKGDRITWDALWSFTEAERGPGGRYGSDDAIACAVVKVGDQTEAARESRRGEVALSAAGRRLDAAKERADEAEGKAEDRLRQLLAETARANVAEVALAACQASGGADCSAQDARIAELERDYAMAIAIGREQVAKTDALEDALAEFVPFEPPMLYKRVAQETGP